MVGPASGNPYGEIPGRNVFRLSPPRIQITEPPRAALPRIKLVGITTVFGDRRAFLKVQLPAQAPEGAKEYCCILAEGQREGEIEVMAVDEKAGTVKVNNSGTEMVLKFEADSPSPP